MAENSDGKGGISDLRKKIMIMRQAFDGDAGDSIPMQEKAELNFDPPTFQSFASQDNSKFASFASVVKDSSAKEKINFRRLHGSMSMAGSDVVLSTEDVKKVNSKFSNTLYGYFLGKRLAYPIVENFAKNAWKKYGFSRSMMNGKGFFFFQFDSKRGMERVLEDGPWMIRGVPILLNTWNPSVKLNKEDIRSVPVWVKLHNVPLAAFSEDGLSMLATQVGTPKLLDNYTSDMCRDLWGRSSFARALIEISSEHELKEEIIVAIPVIEGEGFVKEYVQVEYEWKPPRCASCCVFGHSNSQCPKAVLVEKPKVINSDGFQPAKNKGKSNAKKGIPMKQGPKVIYRPVIKEAGNVNGLKQPCAEGLARSNKPDAGPKPHYPKYSDKGGSSKGWEDNNPFSALNPEETGDDGEEESFGGNADGTGHFEGASTPCVGGLNG